MDNLTPKQKQVLDYLTEFIGEHGYSPTLEQIGKRFRLRALSNIHKHVTNLHKKGWITREKRTRGFSLIDRTPKVHTAAFVRPGCLSGRCSAVVAQAAGQRPRVKKTGPVGRECRVLQVARAVDCGVEGVRRQPVAVLAAREQPGWSVPVMGAPVRRLRACMVWAQRPVAPHVGREPEAARYAADRFGSVGDGDDRRSREPELLLVLAEAESGSVGAPYRTDRLFVERLVAALRCGHRIVAVASSRNSSGVSPE